MARFMIEVPHKDESIGYARAISILYSTGSHFLTNTDWGGCEGDYKSWLIVDVESEREARSILPPLYRSTAKIVQLNKFSMEGIEPRLKYNQNTVSKTGTNKSIQV